MNEMKLELLNTSVVVTAQDHNPTILHPTFLTSVGIVPEDWQLVEPPICTPAMSTVRYANRISFIVTMDRFQLKDDAASVEFRASRVPELASNYIEKLPHVRYTGVGVNVQGFVEHSDAEALLVKRFLKTGAWNTGSLKPQALGLRFAYQVVEGTLRLSCDAGVVRRIEEKAERKGIILDANYHREITESNRMQETTRAIRCFAERGEHLLETAKLILGLEA